MVKSKNSRANWFAFKVQQIVEKDKIELNIKIQKRQLWQKCFLEMVAI